MERGIAGGEYGGDFVERFWKGIYGREKMGRSCEEGLFRAIEVEVVREGWGGRLWWEVV